MHRAVAPILVGFLTAGCLSEAPGALGPAADGDGPRVVYDPAALPDPEVPFPNDLGTRYDDSSATGRRLNFSTDVPLQVEADLRHQLNRLDGFSVNGWISVEFDAPIDLETADSDGVKLIDVTPGSPDFGREVPLDFGDGAFPIHFRPRAVFPFEPDADLTDLLLGRDNDVNGVRVTHYEVETNTLLLRPLFPLRPKTTYAVVLTTELQGLDGAPVRSPFGAVNHTAQTRALTPVVNMVPGGLDAIAFTWSFTTRSVADDLLAIRDGLDGQGALSWLHEEYPGRFLSFNDTGDDDEDGAPHLLQGDTLPELLAPLALAFPSLDALNMDGVDYFVFGTFEAPDFRGPDRTIWVRGDEVDHTRSQVTFTLSVPETTEEHQPPFPVVLYNHGARTSRFELLLIAASMGRAGIAMIGIDAAGHGPFGGDIESLLRREASSIDPALLAGLIGSLAQSLLGDDYDWTEKVVGEILADLAEHGLWRALFVDGRATDRDGDGVLLSGDGYFVPNPFELSSNGLQTVIDNLSLFRLLGRLDPANATDRFSGDFNEDGVLDVGGPDVDYFAVGTSLGGFHTSILLAAEPGIVTGVPIVSGGGFTDVMVRTDLADAVDAILAEPLGPAIVGCPVPGEDAVIALTWNNWSLKCRDEFTIAIGEENSGLGRIAAAPGETVVLRNLRLLETAPTHHLHEAEDTNPITDSGGFSVKVAADLGDPLELVVLDADGEEVERLHIEARRAGLGRHRNTPRLRRLIQVAQTAMDPGDPLAWAPHLNRYPLDDVPSNVLHIAAIGDRTVPFATKVAFDRAAGLLGDEEKALEITRAFIDHGGLDGEKPHWDIDDLQGTGDGIGPLPVIETTSGVSAVRYAATDDHEYIALANPDADFDWATYSRNQIIHFLQSRGTEVRDDLCLEDTSCPFLP